MSFPVRLRKYQNTSGTVPKSVFFGLCRSSFSVVFVLFVSVAARYLAIDDLQSVKTRLREKPFKYDHARILRAVIKFRLLLHREQAGQRAETGVTASEMPILRKIMLIADDMRSGKTI